MSSSGSFSVRPTASPKRVLFVDDDTLLLRSLSRTMKMRARDWHLAFENDPLEAMARLERDHFDAVVTDMQMPDVDGATLLRHARACQPSTVRVVMSAYADRAAVHRSLAVAHRFFSKPCDPAVLHNALRSVLDVREDLASRGVLDLIGGFGPLPPLPALYAQVSEAIEDPDVSLHDIGDMVSRDIAISAKVLQLVNNAFIGLPRPTNSVVEAVTYIGTKTLKHLLLSVEIFRVLKPPPRWFSIEAEHRHALEVASLAMRLAPDRVTGEEAFAASMLHDIGRFLLATEIPERTQEVHDHARAHGLPAWESERLLLGASHAEVGAYLLLCWGLPWPIVEAVAEHHAPSHLTATPFGVAHSVHAANLLVRRKRGENIDFDPSFLKAHGIDDERRAAWEAAAEPTRKP